MHPLHDHIAGQVAAKLTARRVVVWYDERFHVTERRMLGCS